MTRALRSLAALLFLLPVSASAQEPLRVQQAVQDALANSPSIRAARSGTEAEAETVNAARAGWWPRVSLSESWQRGDQPVFVFSSLLASRQFGAENFAIAALNYPDPVSYFHATAAVEQLIYDGGARGAAVTSAELRRDLADVTVRETALSLAAQVTETYGRLVAVEGHRRSASAVLAAGREDYARASRRRDGGLATDADVLALAVHVADFEQRVIQADGDAAVLRAQLNRLTGAPIERIFAVVEPTPRADTAPASMEGLFAEAESARPEVARALAAEQLATANGQSARSVLVPQVAAQAAFDLNGTEFQQRASAWLVGGQVRWTFSTGGVERAQMKAAAAAATRARADAEDARAAVRVEVVTALARMQSARARQAVGRAAVDQARESQRIIRNRYDAGLVPVNDVLRAAAAVVEADTQRVAALVDAMTSAALLDRALGRLP